MRYNLPHLSSDVELKLQKICRAAKSPRSIALRAAIILLVYQGENNNRIAQQLRCTFPVIRKWINRFILRPSIGSLRDAPRSGRPPTIPGIAKCEVVKCACMPLSDVSLDNWTLNSLQAAVFENTGFLVSKSEISRILNNKNLRPQKVQMWMHSPDPNFRQKVNRIAQLYLTPPERSIVLCIDEKTGIQAVERRKTRASIQHRCVLRYDTEYKRHGTQALIAAYEPKTGHVFAKCGKTRKTGDIEGFIEEIASFYREQEIYVIWDNLNIHQRYRWWTEFKEKHGNRFHFVYTPVHASWINQIECWFGILQKKVIKHGSFMSEEDLKQKILDFIELWNNEKAHPFKWQFRGYWDRAA